jgi:hypothetical protein
MGKAQLYGFYFIQDLYDIQVGVSYQICDTCVSENQCKKRL